jgi:PAS domain S-box-containing protein
MDWLSSLLGRSGFLPHGYCFAWTPGLLWTMVTADALIALAYFSIPLTIVHFIRKRGVDSNHWVPWLFSGFIFACGLTHVMDIWTIWRPDYALSAMAKALTAAISVLTAVALWRLVPKALAIPTVRELQAAIVSLQAEVNQRKTAQDSLADAEQSLSVTLASIEAGFIATDGQGRVTRMNAVAERITGWAQGEARDRVLWEVFAREGRDTGLEARNPVEVMLDLGVTIDQARHTVCIARDGTRTPLEVKSAVRRTDDGSVRGIAMVFRDMTRINSAEAAQRRLAAMVASSNDAIIGSTLDGRITDWNNAAQSMFGYSEAEAIGQPVQMLIPPDLEIEEMRLLADLAAGRTVPAFDTLRQAKDGQLQEVSITISPILDGMGRIVGSSKIARDVSHQRRTEQALRESEAQQRKAEMAHLRAQRLEAENRQIQESSRLKSQFLANMSHELRTPLNAIIGFADLLHTGAVPADSPKHREFLAHIGTSGRHLLQLINDVLDLSKVESGKFEFFPEPVDLSRLVKEVCDVLHTAVNRKRLRLAIDIDPAVSQLVVDPGRLKQALYNYLSNAIKFTPERGDIGVRAFAEGPRHFHLEVHDSGIGIQAADLPRLFVEFQQLDASHSRQHQGTGLGLSLTRRLVEAQGGSVGVRSTPGVGSVFHLVLPRDMTQPNAGERPVGSAPAAASAHHRWLLIEEPGEDQSERVQGLTQAGFEVDAALTGEQAIRQATGNAYDAISLDLVLPDRGGLEVLSSIRATQGPSRDSPVVTLSMPLDAGPHHASFVIADVLSKPIRGDEVVLAMDRCGLLDRPEAKVMVIDDDPVALDLMRATLHSLGVNAICQLDARQALYDMDFHQPDALILDLMMPGFDGFEALDELGRMPDWQHLPVFVWTSMILTDEEHAALARSARAILGKGGGALQDVLERLQGWRPPVAMSERSPL